MNTAQALCSCGKRHPAGFVCTASSLKLHEKSRPCSCAAGSCGQSAHAPAALQNASEKDEATEEDDAPPQNAGCGTGQCVMPAARLAPLAPNTATRAAYRINAMCCPMEEALIRKKLESMPGIQALEFNLMQRTLVVHHTLPSTQAVENALVKIGMPPENLDNNDGMASVFSLPGMDCPVEEKLVSGKLSGMDGVLGFEIDLIRRQVSVRHTPSALPAIAKALDSLQLGASLLAKGEAPAMAESVIPWRRLLFAGVFAAFSEVFELLHAWQLRPFGLNLPQWSIGSLEVAAIASVALAFAAIAASGLDTFKKGWVAVKNFNLNINALMSVAVTGALVIGQYPEAAMVMVLFTLAEALEAKSLDRARKAIKNLLALAPETATVQRSDGTWADTDIRQVEKGSRIRVKPGERIALDGLIVEGHSSINQAPITGESLPVEKSPGDTVFAGSINESGSFEFEVTALSGDSTLARIIHAVEEAQSSRAPMQRFVDSFAAYYTPAVFFGALLAAVIPPLFMAAAWTESVYTALVLLVIGCPCALVISTPVTIVSAMAAATRSGILIKGGMFLEQGRLLRWLALDKTGTITHGKPVLTDTVDIADTGLHKAEVLAASLAVRSDHPVSKAVAEAFFASRNALPVHDFTALAGRGVRGSIDGVFWHMGNLRLVKELDMASPALEERFALLEKQGKSVVALCNPKGVAALFAVADTVKDSSIEAIADLKKLGVRTMMLTGDNDHTAKAIAAQVGVDAFRGSLLPEDKLAAVQELAKDGITGMVGDGINDAPALAGANIGFAMAAAGADTAIETADVALMDDDLRKIPRFIRLSKATRVILIENISLALGVKALFFALALGGVATMWMAVFADVGASLMVVANGLRAMKK